MANLFWKLVSKWAVPRRSFDVLESLSEEQGRLYERAGAEVAVLKRQLERFQGKVVIGPAYHRHVARLLSVSCQLVDNPRSIDLKNQVTDLAIKFQQPEVVEAMDGSLNG